MGKALIRLKHIGIGKFQLAFLVIFCTSLGMFAGSTLIYSLVLDTFGAKIIPTLNIVHATLNIGLVLISEYIFRKNKKSVFLDRLVASFALTLALVYLGIVAKIPFLIPLGFVLVSVLMAQISVQSNILISKLFSLSELKKVYPRLSLAFSFGNIAAGVVIGLLSTLAGGPASLLILFFVCLVCILFFEKLFRRYEQLLLKDQKSLAQNFQNAFILYANQLPEKTETAQKGLLEQFSKIKTFFVQLGQYRIVRFLLGISVLQLICLGLYKFWFDSIVADHFSGSQLTLFLGYVNSISSTLSVINNLFLAEKTLKKVSFSRTYLFQSQALFLIMSVLAFGTLIGMPFLYLLAAFGYIVFMTTMSYTRTSQNFIFSFVPKKDRDSIRTFLENIGSALSAILSALAIAILIQLMPQHMLIFFILIPAAVFIWLGWKLAHTAYKLIATELKQEDPGNEVLDMIAERRGYVVEKLLITVYPFLKEEKKLKAVKALGEMKTESAHRFLLSEFFKGSVEMKKQIIRSLKNFKQNHTYLLMYLVYEKSARSLLKEAMHLLSKNRQELKKLIARDFLQSSDHKIQELAILLLEELRATEYAKEICELTASHLPLHLQEQAIKALYRMSPSTKADIEKRVEYYLQCSEASLRVIGLRLIGKLYLPRLEWYLIQAIDNTTEHFIKSTALKSLADLNPDIAIRYFAYFMTNQEEETPFYAEIFSHLHKNTRQKIVQEISRLPVEAVDRAIKNMLPFRKIVLPEWQELYQAISKKFEMNRR